MNTPIGRFSFSPLMLSVVAIVVLALPAAAESYASSQASSQASSESGFMVGYDPFFFPWYGRSVSDLPLIPGPPVNMPVAERGYTFFTGYPTDVVPIQIPDVRRQTGYARIIPFGY